MNLQQRSDFIKKQAARLGFMSCGISKAGFLEEEAHSLEKWLRDGMHGEMGYMANHFDKRLDPTLLVDGAKSVISFLYNYYPEEQQSIGAIPKISKYAYGQDYHHVVKGKLRELHEEMNTHIGEIGGRAFVDSAPVLDRAWARKSGLGWIGKNANLLTRQVGSFYFIAEMIVDIELAYDDAVTDHCGKCTRCIDACPTQAIEGDRIVNGSKCISYLTIELKERIPEEFKGKMDNWMFGCDTCQDVCPWNRFSKPHQEPLFTPHEKLLDMQAEDWLSLDEDTFREVFRKSPVKRTKFSGLSRNIDFLDLPDHIDQ